MTQFLESILEQIRPSALIDIGITALLAYWLFSLIRGTRAVRLVIGVSVLIVVYAAARVFDLRLLTWILENGAVVGLFAVVVVFQPELRRALERIGRVGSFAWLFSPAESRAVEHVSDEVARAAAGLSRDGHGALIVFERETGLEEVAETGVMIHGDVSADLLRTIFAPRTALHDGAVIIRGESIVSAGSLLPLAETSIHTERYGTRHRAALGITEQTDAVVVVISEENRQISLVERARIVRNLNQVQLARALKARLDPTAGRRSAFGLLGSNGTSGGRGGRAPRLADLGRLMGRSPAPAKAGAAGGPGASSGAGTGTAGAGASGTGTVPATPPAPAAAIPAASRAPERSGDDETTAASRHEPS